MAKPIEGEVIGPEEDHAYNDPELSPKQFLIAVMRDRRVPLTARMEAAAKVSVFEHPRLAQVSQDINAGVRIIIEGGLPALPGTNIIMPEVHVDTDSTISKKGNGHDPDST